MVKTDVQAVPTITLELTVGEAGALQAICGYGPKVFLEWFERNLGKHYLAAYREHVISLFDKGYKLNKDVERYQEFLRKLAELAKEHNVSITHPRIKNSYT